MVVAILYYLAGAAGRQPKRLPHESDAEEPIPPEEAARELHEDAESAESGSACQGSDPGAAHARKTDRVL